jgi:hypothetical protein
MKKLANSDFENKISVLNFFLRPGIWDWQTQTHHRSCSRVGDADVSASRTLVQEAYGTSLTPHEYSYSALILSHSPPRYHLYLLSFNQCGLWKVEHLFYFSYERKQWKPPKIN